MHHILAIEDSPRSQELIKFALQGHYQVKFLNSAAEVSAILASQHVDLILLDVNMPGEDGIQFFSKFAGQISSKNIPVIFLTAHTEISYKISAFKLGAADYISKPFEPIELLLRIEARLKNKIQKNSSHITSDLYIDYVQCALFNVVDERHEKIDLSPTEFKLICFFSDHPNQIFSRNQIFDHVWGENTNYLDRTIDRHISTLKKKIPFFKHSLKTAYGVGYILQLDTNSLSRRSA